MKIDKKLIILIIVIILLVIIDQGLKIYSYTNYNKGNTNSIFIYEKVENSIGQENILSYIITNIIVMGIIIRFLVNQKEKIGINVVVMISFLLSGGISNLIDKVFIGNIINYIKIYSFPAINFAFIFIIIGCVGLAGIFAWNTYKEFNQKKKVN